MLLVELVRGVCSCLVPPLSATTSHAVMPTANRRARTIIIGDVHGCLLELQQLLQKCQYSQENDCVVLVGDLVNKGPKSAEVVAFVRRSGFFCVRGNHDERALKEWETREMARQQGQLVDAEDKYAYTDKFSKEDVRFLQELPYTLTIPQEDTIVVHAGLVPGVPIPKQHPVNMTKMRTLLRDNERWQASETNDGVPWAREWKGPSHVIFGHDAKRRLQSCTHATGLDTGCCYGGQLTALILPERRLVSVDAESKYASIKV